MEKILSKTSFPLAPGGDRYEWKEAETIFQIPIKGLFAIKIAASAKNAKQNRGKDDDDLRIALDGFDFGKYEQHQEMVSWKGFGTSASWDGATLKGGTKTIYFFIELENGKHLLQFFTDETPSLKSIEVFKIENNAFELTNLKPTENIKSGRNGIPWLSFIFLGTHTQNFILAVDTKSARTKRSTDGDNLKVIVNGRIKQNPYASESYKYKNFYFSGDIKEFDILSISDKDLDYPIAFENAVDLWYDEEPEISSLDIKYFDNEAFLERLKEFVDLKKYVFQRAHAALYYFRKTDKPYSAKFLEHAMNPNPSNLIFERNDPIIRKLKADPTYRKILNKLREKIANGYLDGEIWPEDFKNTEEMNGQINFNSPDLATTLHGIHKIEYSVKPFGNNKFAAELVFFDIYDFEKQRVPFFLTRLKEYITTTTTNALDIGEDLGLIHNFEIEIRLKETIYADH